MYVFVDISQKLPFQIYGLLLEGSPYEAGCVCAIQPFIRHTYPPP